MVPPEFTASPTISEAPSLAFRQPILLQGPELSMPQSAQTNPVIPQPIHVQTAPAFHMMSMDNPNVQGWDSAEENQYPQVFDYAEGRFVVGRKSTQRNCSQYSRESTRCRSFQLPEKDHRLGSSGQRQSRQNQKVRRLGLWPQFSVHKPKRTHNRNSLQTIREALATDHPTPTQEVIRARVTRRTFRRRNTSGSSTGQRSPSDVIPPPASRDALKLLQRHATHDYFSIYKECQPLTCYLHLSHQWRNLMSVADVLKSLQITLGNVVNQTRPAQYQQYQQNPVRNGCIQTRVQNQA